MPLLPVILQGGYIVGISHAGHKEEKHPLPILPAPVVESSRLELLETSPWVPREIGSLHWGTCPCRPQGPEGLTAEAQEAVGPQERAWLFVPGKPGFESRLCVLRAGCPRLTSPNFIFPSVKWENTQLMASYRVIV